MDLISAAATATLLCCVGLLWHWARSGNNKIRPPPRLVGNPLLGNIMLMISGTEDTLAEMRKKLGGLFTIRVLWMKTVLLCDWKHAKEAFVRQSAVFSSKGSCHPSLGNIAYSFLQLSGAVWKEKRRFAIRHLRNLAFGKVAAETVISDEIAKTFAILDEHVGRPLNFKDIFFRPLLNVAWGLAAGKTYGYEDPKVKHLHSLVKTNFSSAVHCYPVVSLPLLRHLPGDFFRFHQLVRTTEQLFAFIEEEVDEHRRTIDCDNPRDFMDVYLREIIKREGKQLSEGEQCYQKGHLLGTVFDFFNAGIETVGTTLEWSILCMSIWPQIQKKVQQEIDDVIGNQRTPVYSDYAKMTYTKATIIEVQRYCSVIPICTPRLTNADATVCGYDIPKQSIVTLNCHAVHFDEADWSEPRLFHPERFLNDVGKVVIPDNWIPFSAGPRSCPGEPLARIELFLFFTSMMQRYSFRCVTGEPLPSLEPIRTLTRQPKPFKLILKHRSING